MKKSSFKDLFFVLIYTFNAAGLPFGFFWSNLFSPFLLIYLYIKQKIPLVLLLFFSLLFYMLLQFTTQPYHDFIELKSFLTSGTYFFTSIISGLFFYFYLQEAFIEKRVELLFKKLLQANALLTFIALLLYFTPFQGYMWGISDNINIEGQVRLKMFFSEPSHYGYMAMPLLLYISLKIILLKQYEYLFLFFMTFLSAWLCQSTGTLGALFLALVLSVIIYFRLILKKYLLQIISVVFLIMFVFSFFGDNLSDRLDKVLAGKDHSGQVRVVFSTLSAFYLIEKYNISLGVGFGQAKTYVTKFTGMFQGYKTDRLPSSFSSTLATLGIVAVVLKYLTLFYLMVRHSTYSNIFQLTIFLYVLIYGFTGGWLLNTYEIFLWALAFLKIFPEFEYKNLINRKTS